MMYLPERIRLGDLATDSWTVTTMDALARDNDFDADVCAALDVLADGALRVERDLGAAGTVVIERLCAHGDVAPHLIDDDERPALGLGRCDGPQICSRVADHGGVCSLPTVKGHGDRIVRYRLAHVLDADKLMTLNDHRRRAAR
jgi:hypothetical protein